MEKKIVSLFIAVAAFVSVKAQVSENAVASVRYTFEYVSDTTHPNDKASENMILLLGKDVSVYKSYDKMKRDSTNRAQLEKRRSSDPSMPISVVGYSTTQMITPTAFYKYPASGKIQRVESFMKYYVIDEKLPAINWTISSETKNIQELVCQKATGDFRGRHYTAWFAPQLPYSNGPWKLGGLPGLIVEAADDKNEVVFHFAGFEDVSGRNMSLALPDNSIKATAKEYAQLRTAAANDPSGFASNSVGGAVSVMASGTFRPSANVQRRIYNNPIELTEN